MLETLNSTSLTQCIQSITITAIGRPRSIYPFIYHKCIRTGCKGIAAIVADLCNVQDLALVAVAVLALNEAGRVVRHSWRVAHGIHHLVEDLSHCIALNHIRSAGPSTLYASLWRAPGDATLVLKAVVVIHMSTFSVALEYQWMPVGATLT